jgi:hypothetical protein
MPVCHSVDGNVLAPGDAMGGWRRGAVAAVALATLALTLPAPAGAQAAAPATWNTEPVGHVAPGGSGSFADVWAHRDIAYLGSLRSGDCRPASGVWAIDLRDPARPRPLSSFAKFPGTDAQDVWVGTVRTPAFSGDLAAVGIQRCARQEPSFAGLALYDVSDPARPRPLGQLATGVPAGVHELGVIQRADGRLLVLAAVPGSFGLSQGRQGDLRIIDATDPRRPRQLADWDVRRDGPLAARSQLAARQDVFDHSAWPMDGGRKLFASFWAAGVQFLDIADPSRPRLIGQTGYRDGDGYRAAHSGWFNDDETLFVQNDEAMSAVGEGAAATWTSQRIFDTSRLDHPTLLSTFATESAVPGRDGRVRRDGVFSVHNAVIRGTVEYASWYSDGVRVVDLADPRHPREVAWFVPPRSAARQTAVTARDGDRGMPLVWGVYPWKDLVLASDINSGLWVFRVRLDRDQAPSQGAAAGQPATPTAAAPQPAAGASLLARLAAVLVALGLLGAALAARRTRRRAG